MRDRRHTIRHWLSTGLLLLLTQVSVSTPETLGVMEVEGRVGQATAPAELQRFETKDRVADRIWTSEGPGMRVFAHGHPDRALALETLEAAGIAALPVNGYVVAGSVQGPGGRELWVARFDADHDLLWSRMLGGAFDLHLTAMTALGDDGVLIGGALDAGQAGFLIALDAQGEPCWTRVLGGVDDTPVEVPLTLATDAAGNALVAGEYLVPDGQVRGVAVLITAAGETDWHLELPATTGVRSVIRTHTGWSIAGASSGTSGAPWVAGLDPAGHLTWERTYEDLAGPGAPVLAGLDAGGIALAVLGAEGTGNQIWLRRLSPAGEPLETRRLGLEFGAQDGLETLAALTRDAEGALWLAGMTQGQDAWLARLSSAGEVLWGRRYGRAARDRFTDLLAQTEGLIAVGYTQTQDDLAPGLWVATLDAEGQPRPRPEYSPGVRDLIARLESSLAALGDKVHLGGTPVISHQADGHLRFRLPFLRIEDELPLSNESVLLDVNWLNADLTPGPTPDGWQVALHWPRTLRLRDRDGNEIGTLQTSGQHLELDWPASDDRPQGLDFGLEGLRVQLDGQAQLQPIHEALGLPRDDLGGDDTDLGLMTLGRLRLAITPGSPPGSARTSTSQTLELADLGLKSRSGTDSVWLGGLRLGLEYRDLDLAALATDSKALLELSVSAPETPDLATLHQGLERLFQASGQVATSVVMTDFAAHLPSQDLDYQVDEFRLSAQGNPADDAHRSWTLRIGYGLSGLRLQQEGQDGRIGTLSLDLTIDRLVPAALLDAALGQPPAAAALGQALGQPVVGAELGLAVEALHLALPDAPAVNIDAMHLALALSEVDGPRPRLRLDYDHAGIRPIPELPPELVPDRVDLGLVLSGLTPSALLPILLQGEPDPTQLLRLLAHQSARLDIETIAVELPGTGVRIRGVAKAEETVAPGDPGRIRLDLDIRVRDLDTLVERIGHTLSAAERRDLEVAAALIKLMGDEERQPDGIRLHRFEVQGDSTGELRVNGKDLKPILEVLQ